MAGQDSAEWPWGEVTLRKKREDLSTAGLSEDTTFTENHSGDMQA